MENSDLLRRAEDLQRRCEKNGVLTATHFLTPAERFQLERWAKTQPGCRLVFSGGHPDCERTVGFFLPDWLDEEWLPLDEQICALELSAPFGNPGHRDYLGALLGMGIGRERLGDIWVKDGSAVVFCLPGVEKHLLSIDKVGRDAVRARPLALTEVTPPERKVKKKAFRCRASAWTRLQAGCLTSPAARLHVRWRPGPSLSTMKSAISVMPRFMKVTFSPCGARGKAASSASAAPRARAGSSWRVRFISPDIQKGQLWMTGLFTKYFPW